MLTSRNVRFMFHRAARTLIPVLPLFLRTRFYRRMIHCDPAPPNNLKLKLAETQEELEACFKLLHGAYVRAGLQQPHPSGLRATLYHALPTTSTLLASWDGEVVGTVSLVRQSKLGFPLQKIFDIRAIEQLGGNIAEVSALAVAPRFQARGGIILFPLLKFMYEYATRLFDTRHLVIAVNPRHIGFYESILFFRRLRKQTVEHYDFVNGAPAIGATLDLHEADRLLRGVYDHLDPARNLYRYFKDLRLNNIAFPGKRFYTTTDPVMTPKLLDYFFNQRTQLFASLGANELRALHDIYDLPAYRSCLPPVPAPETVTHGKERRRHRRFSISCPGQASAGGELVAVRVLECSSMWVRARIAKNLAIGGTCRLAVQLGANDRTDLEARVMRRATSEKDTYILQIEQADLAWSKFVNALSRATTHQELEHATQFLEN